MSTLSTPRQRLPRALDRWAQRREDRQIRRWHKYFGTRPDSAPDAKKCSFYLRGYFAGIALGLTSTIGFLFADQLIVLWTVAMCVIAATATLFRRQIRGRDSAPPSLVDEYEADVINRWRRVSYDLLLWACITFTSCIAIATVLPDEGQKLLGHSGSEWAYFLCLLFYLAIFVIISLPIIGYTAIFAVSDAEPDEQQELSMDTER